MARTTAATPLAAWLDDQLDQRQWGVRTLAKQVNPANPEVARRMLNRCLFDGSQPSDDNIRAIAAALEVPADEVPVDNPFRDEAA